MDNYGYNAYMPQYGVNSPYMAQRQQVNTYAYVNGLEGAKAYITPPNSKVLLMDSDNPIFYLKESNQYGQASLRTFKFEEVVQQPIQAKVGEYVSVTDFNSVLERITKIEESINATNTNKKQKDDSKTV